jgi:hypothetical protein
LEADEVLQPIKDNFVKHYPALAVTSDEINEKIQYLLDIKWIDTELEFDSKLTAVENKYNLKTIKEFRVLSNKNGNSILSLYYSLFDEYVDSVGVTYNSYLGDEKTDMMYKDLCMIADRACSMARGEDTEENSSKVSYRPKSLSKWDYDGRVTPFEAVDHQVFFTLIEGEDKWMCKNLPSIEVDERHPHLGITPQVMNKNLLLLSKDAEFMDFNSSIKRDDDGTYYQYVFEESKGGKPVISLLLLLTNDGKYIRAIQVSYSKESKLYNAELRTKFKKLRKMTDIAFVMAKDDINSYNDFSSTNYPLPEPAKALGEIIPVSKAYDNTVYIMEGEDESFVEYWIDTANAQKEYSYLTDYFKIN